MVDHSKIWRILFNRPILKLIVLIILAALLYRLDKGLSTVLEASPILSISIFILNIAILVYSVILIIRIILIYMLRKPLSQLFRAQNLATLLASYAIFILSIIILISIAFMEIQYLNLGYITYGKCSDKFSSDMIDNDPFLSRDYMYFSSVTFFTIGYGDICPMGVAKFLSIITAFIGNLVTVVLMGIVITLYMKRRERNNPVHKT